MSKGLGPSNILDRQTLYLENRAAIYRFSRQSKLMWIDRPRHPNQLRDLLSRHPVVAILGARQVGKTTLARQLTADY